MTQKNTKKRGICKSNHPLIRKLHELRKKKNVSQERLAKHAGLNRNAVLIWEHGNGTPNLMNFEACVNALGYDLLLRERND